MKRTEKRKRERNTKRRRVFLSFPLSFLKFLFLHIGREKERKKPREIEREIVRETYRQT